MVSRKNFMLEDSRPDPWLKWEIEINADASQMPQKILCEAFEDAVILNKQGHKIGIGMTIVELETAIAMLSWIVSAAIKVQEAEQAVHELTDVKRSIEGK